MGLFSWCYRKDEDKICGFLDIEGRFFKEKKDRDDSDYYIKSQRLRAMGNRSLLEFMIKEISANNPEAIDSLVQISSLLEKGEYISRLLEHRKKFYDKMEELRKEYNK